MKNKKLFNKITAVFTAVVIILSAFGRSVSASGETDPGLEKIMKGLSEFVYKVYEWPESLNIGNVVFSIVESLYTMREHDGSPVLWEDETMEEQMKDFYSTTDWNQFEGMYESIELTNSCAAVLTEEVQAYASLMDAAADEQGFTMYKELFKAIAQARFNEHKQEYEYAKSQGKINGTGDDDFDLFHISGSWIDGGKTPLEIEYEPPETPTPTPAPSPAAIAAPAATGTPVPGTPTPWPEEQPLSYQEDLKNDCYTVDQSIELAAKAFRQIIDSACYPTPFDTDKLICVVEGFEFGGNSDAIQEQFESATVGLTGITGFITFTEYCLAKQDSAADAEGGGGAAATAEGEAAGGEESGGELQYDEVIADYAKVIAHDAERPSGDQETYGKYRYSDQKFYQKVFEVYQCSGNGGSLELGNLPEEFRNLLQQCMKSWDSKVNSARRAIIQNAVSLYGVEYSMAGDKRNCPSIENPRWLDCSSFTGQAYWRANIGYERETATWTTGIFVNNFDQIPAEKLIPGDIAQITWNPGGSGGSEHVGIYIGQIDGTRYYIHCASGRGVIINNYNFTYFGRGRLPILNG